MEGQRFPEAPAPNCFLGGGASAPLQRVAAAATATATAANPSPGSKPLANHVPRGCTNPFLTLTLTIL